MAGLEVHEVSKRYGARWALVRVSFRLAAGEIAMLAGRNGSGKSTLLRVLATALRPDLRHGPRRAASTSSPTATRSAAGSRCSTTARTCTTSSPRSRTSRSWRASWAMPRWTAAALMAVLEEVGLADRADDPVAAFSAGMRKRLALARVLLKAPEVALLDEPYGELDPPGFRLVDGVLDRLRRRGATVLMATHLVERGREHCDRALVLAGGGRANGTARRGTSPADAGLAG